MASTRRAANPLPVGGARPATLTGTSPATGTVANILLLPRKSNRGGRRLPDQKADCAHLPASSELNRLGPRNRCHARPSRLAQLTQCPAQPRRGRLAMGNQREQTVLDASNALSTCAPRLEEPQKGAPNEENCRRCAAHRRVEASGFWGCPRWATVRRRWWSSSSSSRIWNRYS